MMMSRRDKLNEVFERVMSSSTQSINQTDISQSFPTNTHNHQNVINSCIVNFLAKLEQDIQTDYTSNFRKFDIDEILQDIETKLNKDTTSADTINSVKSIYTAEINLLEIATQKASNELTHILEKIDHSKADIDVEVAAVQQENKEFKDIISQFT